ncbi:MAG: hypothetical protein ACKOEL_00050 [Planctomycetota bacterium]
MNACARACAIGLATALAPLGAGCTARLADLSGPRTVTEWIPAAGPDGMSEVPATFVLRNSTLGTVRVESLRLPISTEVRTDPPLPASIGPGGTLRLVVTGRFWPADGAAVRAVRLETAGDVPLELTIDGRVKPSW